MTFISEGAEPSIATLLEQRYANPAPIEVRRIGRQIVTGALYAPVLLLKR